jgi:hypothetical protein
MILSQRQTKPAGLQDDCNESLEKFMVDPTDRQSRSVNVDFESKHSESSANFSISALDGNTKINFYN